LHELAPGVEIIGAESPPFRLLTEREEAEMTDRIRRLRPDIVWVGLGTPRQDLFIDQFRDRLGATLVAVGAAFDFLAGAKRQAPSWMQNSGLEWAFRLATEPRRLWRRYLVGNTRFLRATWSQFLGFCR
jgi:N-acetylglucosaminyldiphosphoundecaprenol N-acetyl-beta-D-mannosaminyltransferase